jgi:hypothetical protein
MSGWITEILNLMSWSTSSRFLFFDFRSTETFHMLFHWKKTKQLNNHTDHLAQPRRPPGVRGPPFEKHWYRGLRMSIPKLVVPDVRFQVLIAASVKMTVFWDGASCSKFSDVSEAASTYETSGNFYQTTRRNISEDSHFTVNVNPAFGSSTRWKWAVLPTFQRNILPPSSKVHTALQPRR